MKLLIDLRLKMFIIFIYIHMHYEKRFYFIIISNLFHLFYYLSIIFVNFINILYSNNRSFIEIKFIINLIFKQITFIF